VPTISNIRRSEQILTALSLIEVIENSDYTKSHSLRVAKLVKEIGIKMGLGSEENFLLRRAALFHDIGKIGFSHIIMKTEPITDEEMEIIKGHCEIGYKLLMKLGMPQEANLVLQHHERPDGSGYPKGLKYGEIDDLTNILVVADVYDAAIMERPYKKGDEYQNVMLNMYKDADKKYPLYILQILHEIVIESLDKKKTLDK